MFIATNQNDLSQAHDSHSKKPVVPQYWADFQESGLISTEPQEQQLLSDTESVISAKRCKSKDISLDSSIHGSIRTTISSSSMDSSDISTTAESRHNIELELNLSGINGTSPVSQSESESDSDSESDSSSCDESSPSDLRHNIEQADTVFAKYASLSSNNITDQSETVTAAASTDDAIDTSEDNNEESKESELDRKDYAFEILFNHLQMDDECLELSSKYRQFDGESEELSKYRSECVHYMHQWYKDFHLNIRSFALAIEILHRLMAELILTKTNPMLVGLTVLYIAAKYHENDNSHSKARLLLNRALSKDCRFYREAVLKLELQFLQNLNFNLTFPSTVTVAEVFLALFCDNAVMSTNSVKLYQTDKEANKRSLKKHIREQIYGILENAMIRCYTAFYKPSVIAAICVKYVLDVCRDGTNPHAFDFRAEMQILQNTLKNNPNDNANGITHSKTGIEIANLIQYFSN